MAKCDNITNSQEVLLSLLNGTENCDILAQLLKRLLNGIMELEISQRTGAEWYEHSDERKTKRSGYRPRRFDTRLGTFNLDIPKLRDGGYVPAFLQPHKRSEAALALVVQEAIINGVSNRKMDKLVKSLGIEGISHSQVSAMTADLNEEARSFRERSLHDHAYPVLWVDAVYERIRYNHRIVSMAVEIVCGVNEDGAREIIAIEPMLEESEDSYKQLFNALKDRGLHDVRLVISDAHKGLTNAIRECFTGASWQRCKVHFMRNIMSNVTKKDRQTFADELKSIWNAKDADSARKTASDIEVKYGKRFPKAIDTMVSGLEDSLAYYAFPNLDARRISSTNMLERLNREVRRRSASVGIFPSPESYVKLVTMHLIEYSESWSTIHCYLDREELQKILLD